MDLPINVVLCAHERVNVIYQTQGCVVIQDGEIMQNKIFLECQEFLNPTERYECTSCMAQLDPNHPAVAGIEELLEAEDANWPGLEVC